MSSKERPKKMYCCGSDGRRYAFLCKMERRGDLRKDARMMETAALLNRFLGKDSEGRKRGLRLRTYMVVCLNEESGVMQWVGNTGGLRGEVHKVYTSLGLRNPMAILKDCRVEFEKLQSGGGGGGGGAAAAKDEERERTARYRSDILPRFPAVFHKWFVLSFSDPSAWFEARLTFSRSAAVWSMVGHMIGLGDRHGENILLDKSTGECVHVDFDCEWAGPWACPLPSCSPPPSPAHCTPPPPLFPPPRTLIHPRPL